MGCEIVSHAAIWAYPQAQGTVTAVQLQTEAPVATAAGQQVQTLQVVVRSLSLQVCYLSHAASCLWFRELIGMHCFRS